MDLCRDCTVVRATAEDFEPGALKDVVVSLKRQIRETLVQEEEFKKGKEKAGTRLRSAKIQQTELHREVTVLDRKIEKRERKILEMEKRIEQCRKTVENNEELRRRYMSECDNSKKEEKELLAKIVAAKAEFKEKWETLAAALKLQTDKELQIRKLRSRETKNQMLEADLNSELQMLLRRLEHFENLKQIKERKSSKDWSVLKQLEDGIGELETRRVLAEQHLFSMTIYQERILDEYQKQFAMTRDMMDKLDNVKRIKKDKERGINVNIPVQPYR